MYLLQNIVTRSGAECTHFTKMAVFPQHDAATSQTNSSFVY